MSMNYDVVVVGAGPVGLATACFIKTVNRNIKICVLDKRLKENRQQGLFLYVETVDQIKQFLFEAVENDHFSSQDDAEHLIKILRSFSGGLVTIQKIVDDLTVEAGRMGVKVLRGNVYEIKNLGALLEFDPDGKGLPRLFQTAKVIIGADGVHSAVRKEVMQNKIVEELQLRYMVELNYRIDEVKLFSVHLYVEKAVFEAMPAVDQLSLAGLGDWTEDPKVGLVHKQFTAFTERMRSRGVNVSGEKVSCSEIKIYRSFNSALNYRERVVLLVGDSESGVISGNGLNKGLKGAAACAYAVSDSFSPGCTNQDVFISYEEVMKQIF